MKAQAPDRVRGGAFGKEGDMTGKKENHAAGRNGKAIKNRKETEKTRAERKKRLLGLAGCSLGLAGLAATGGALGAAQYFYEFSLIPKKHDPRNDDTPSEIPYRSGRLWMQEHVLREDRYLTSADGLRLHANFIASADPTCRRYAICVHGYGDASESMGLYARHYYEEHGMSVLLPDLRGHGESEGNYVGMGLRDSEDIALWIRMIVEYDPEAVIILHGISMGAATVLLATGRGLPENVRAAISDSAYTSAYEEFRDVYRTLPGAVLPADIMLELVRGIARVRAHYDLKEASPLAAVRQSETPTLFIHGDADDFVRPGMMPRLFEAASCPKEFAWFAGSGHVQSVVDDPECYWNRVDRFLDRVSPWILHKNLRSDEEV
ncbi:alpha/beta hydrolase [Lachnoclostridium sp. Marseille-P6806]|uniref:alpha/beta hydrolase n=1 Tax=Lachnoclostridium sp. Marseille-P6806 TaxID=2364793 RepID=UPI001031205F|nr:alpha/beta fold hydrolase [Lachnoclostridium sp. Marseille-P6806]